VIETNAVRMSYEASTGRLLVLEGVSLRCETGQITSIVGPSGCGKSTLLNILAGLDPPDDGSVLVEGKVGYMMQDALLLPWRTLAENAILGAELMNGRTRHDREVLDNYLAAFDLAQFSGIYPQTASGGMKQRLVLIRTLLTQPAVVLLDEPFSNLDFEVKLKIQRFLIEYHLKHSTTLVIVTHDIEDAIALSDKVVILSNRPAIVKTTIPIDIGSAKYDPVMARKSPRFTEYFTRIWEEIKYFDEQ
jgi:NitT/TauT family transport system ATP-binding protein